MPITKLERQEIELFVKNNFDLSSNKTVRYLRKQGIALDTGKYYKLIKEIKYNIKNIPTKKPKKPKPPKQVNGIINILRPSGTYEEEDLENCTSISFLKDTKITTLIPKTLNELVEVIDNFPMPEPPFYGIARLNTEYIIEYLNKMDLFKKIKKFISKFGHIIICLKFFEFTDLEQDRDIVVNKLKQKILNMRTGDF